MNQPIIDTLKQAEADLRAQLDQVTAALEALEAPAKSRRRKRGAASNGASGDADAKSDGGKRRRRNSGDYDTLVPRYVEKLRAGSSRSAAMRDLGVNRQPLFSALERAGLNKDGEPVKS